MMSLTLQASLLQDLGRLEEAHDLLVERYERGVRTQGADHPSTLIAANNVANVLLDLGRPDDAEPVAAETVAIAKERLPDGYWLVGAFQTNHARALIELGRLDEADAVLRDAHQRLEQALGADHDRVHRVEELQARLAQSRGP